MCSRTVCWYLQYVDLGCGIPLGYRRCCRVAHRYTCRCANRCQAELRGCVSIGELSGYGLANVLVWLGNLPILHLMRTMPLSCSSKKARNSWQYRDIYFINSDSCHKGAFKYHVRSPFWCKHGLDKLYVLTRNLIPKFVKSSREFNHGFKVAEE
jgi:hypothetical protein